MPINRSILVVGSILLNYVEKPKTVSQLWESISSDKHTSISFDWFILSLVWLHIINAINYEDGKIRRVPN